MKKELLKELESVDLCYGYVPSTLEIIVIKNLPANQYQLQQVLLQALQF